MTKRGFWFSFASISGLLTFALLYIFIYFFSSEKDFDYNSERKVFIKKDGEKFSLIKDGEPFTIKGGSGFTNIRELAKISGNTIKTWDTTNLSGILDEALKYNIAVIAGFDMLHSSHNDIFYSDPKKVEKQYLAFRNIVEKYKDHPALLMWCLGNELEFSLTIKNLEFYDAYRNLVNMIHNVDPNHPVTTTFWGRSRQDLICLRLYNIDLDIISLNRFGNLHSIKEELENDKWMWDRPFIITEWGINGPWEKERTSWGVPLEDFDKKKADRIEYIYKHYLPKDNPAYLGAMVFFWGQKQETTHTWFSIFDEYNNASRSYEMIASLYQDRSPKYSAPYITEFLLEGLTPEENIVLNPETKVIATVKSFDPNNDSLYFKWEILKEQWYYTPRVTNERPAEISNLIIESKRNKLVFKTPRESGPYRLFVHVQDSMGHYGAANLPFYVLE